MAHLSLALLGQFQAHFDDRLLPGFRTIKVQALLIYLAAEPGPQDREQLMELLWPGMPERSARHNLRQVLYYLRGAFPEAAAKENGGAAAVPLLLSNRQAIQLNPAASVTADIDRFDRLINDTLRHDHLDLIGCPACHQKLNEAVALYRGDFLANFYLDDSNEFEEWAQIKREGYRRRVLDALEIMTTMAIRQQDYPLARSLAERQMEINNLRESSYRQMMEVLALAGRREEALAVYDACRQLLAEELAMEPARRTTELYDQIVAGDLTFETAHTHGVRGYEIKEEIGAGSYGTVHRAVQQVIGREVAVKVIRRRYANNPEFIRRFEDEAQMIARLEHPFVVPLYDYWRDPDGAYLVMRYLKGGSLLTALGKGPWQAEPAVKLIDQISAALASAHRIGILHQDIKPGNILLDQEGNAFLSDFGFARRLETDRSLKKAGEILSTPDYISPEQILNEPLGPPSDLYSLGAVLYETLTGEKPFGNAPVANLIYKHLNEPFPLVSESRPDLPAQIDGVIQKATAKRPADRYENARELADAFRQAVLGTGREPGKTVSMADPAAAQSYNPYKGLNPFEEIDADEFFGRDALVDQLIARLTPGPADHGDRQAGTVPRFLALVGPSGSGKSSVVKAGLIPALRSGAIPGSDRWFLAEMVPGTHPLEELESALWPIAVDPPPSLVDPMQRDVRGMLRTLRRILPDEDGAQLLLVIDQFEELFTLVEDEDRRAFFLESLLVTLTAVRSPLRVVVTLRADFFDWPLQFQKLGHLLKQSTEIVLPMSPEELTWAVREPARHVGMSFEPGLVETIVADVSDQPGGLPLLQYALTELFESRQGHLITRAAYREIGGVQGALSRRAEAIYQDFDVAAQKAARQLFLRLVALGEGGADTRRRLLRSNLEAMALDRLSYVIDAFTAARLLTLDRDPVTRAPTVEVAHEALLREWNRLGGWLDDSRDEVRLRQQLSRAAADWLQAGKDDSYLVRGSRLAQFETLIRRQDLALTHNESAFLDQCRTASMAEQTAAEARRQQELESARQLAESEAQRAHEQSRAAAGLRRRAQILVGVVAVALLLAVTALYFSRLASRQALVAQSRELAAASLLSRPTDPELSLLLAIEALTKSSTTEAEQALHLALLDSRMRQRLVAHRGAIQRVTYSPDGRFIALAAYGEELATIWDTNSGELQHEIPVGRCCWGLYFDNQGRRLAAAEPGPNFSLAVWDTSTGKKIESFSLPISVSTIGPGGSFLSPDWTQAAFWLNGTTLSIWDVQAGSHLFDLPGHNGQVEVEFSRDGQQLVSYDNPDGVVLVWDVATGELIKRLDTGQFINDHAVSPDGTRIGLAVDAGRQGWEVQVWDIGGGGNSGRENSGPAVRLRGHQSTIRLIDFSADGRMIASASREGNAIIWDSETGETLFVLSHSDHVRSVAFHPDGHRLVSSDLNGVARIWDINPAGAAERLGLVGSDEGPTFWADVSPDGQMLVTGGPGRLWDLAAGKLLHELDGHQDTIMSAAFHPDGGRVATASLDGTARVWDTATGKEMFQMTGHGESLAPGLGGVLGIAYHPAGEILATAGTDGTARLWDSRTGRQLHLLEGHTADVAAVAFSPDGRTLATGQSSGQQFDVVSAPTTVILWEAETGEALFSFDSDHGQRVWGLAFSPDGRFLASAGTDATVRLWALDNENGRADLVATLTGHPNTVVGLRFNLDGRTLASATGDEVRLWDVSSLTGRSGNIVVDEMLVLPGGAALDFTPDGQELITGGRDGLVRVYLLDQAELLAFAQSRQTREFTESECRQYLHLDRCSPDQ